MKVIVNVSGGKDSTVAVLETIRRYPREDITLCWQDTGAEYAETEGHLKLLTETWGLPLVTLKHELGFFGLAERRGYWPTPDCRQCTNYLKRHVFEKYLRAHRDEFGPEVIVVSGLRGEESLSRSKLTEWSESPLSTRKQKVRQWNPCISMTEREVYERISSEGLPLHPCYEFSHRCSCWCCIFTNPNVVRAYAELRPDMYEQACLTEDKIKHKWRDGFGFNDLMLQGKLL